ncbi:MAG: TonB-dependent receptor [Alistipes sp.]
MNLRAAMILSSLLFVLHSPLHAQERVDTTKSYAISEISVVGNRTTKEVTPVQTLTGRALQRLNAHSVADAVRYFSGVQIKDYGGIGGLKTVNIRSMGSHHVGVFYDGIELGNAQNGVVDLGRFSLDNMEAVSLYNGQKSAIFQPAKDFASASSIYMTTRMPTFDKSKNNNLNVGIKGGSFATINPSLLWEHRLSERLCSSVSAEYLYTSGRYKFRYAKKNGYDTTEMRKNGDVRMVRVEGALFGKIKQGEWRAKLYFYNSERGYPGASVREEPGRFKHQDRQWDNNLFVQGSWRKQFAAAYSLMLNGKYAYDYLHYRSDPRLDVSTMYVNNHYRQQEAYLSAAHLFNLFGWWSAALSTDFQFNTLDADMVDFVYPNRYSLLTSAATSIRFSRFKLQASLLHTYVNDQTRTAGANAKQKSEFTPTVVASYQPFCRVDLNLRAFYKRVFRMPTLNDLYYTFIGNKDLNPEYTDQYNLGITYTKRFERGIFRAFEVQVDGYYNQVEDKIIAMPTSNQFRWTMLNLGYVEIRGVDMAIDGQWQLGRVQLTSRLNYTYQKAQDFTERDSEWYGGQIPYVPWHSASIILGASFRGWDANYSFIYTGERYEAVANIAENYAQPWYTHDLSLSKSLQLRSVGLRITAEVNNLFNQQYEVVQCYPMPGINFKIKINITL